MRKNRHNKLIVASGPHILGDNNTQKIMGTVLIALLPQLAMSIYVFGFRALTLTAVCVGMCMIFEYVFNLIMKRDQTVGDLSAAVTGVLLAFNLPSGLPYWFAIIGCFVAIIIVKQLFGGIGTNIVNPALAGRIVLLVSFPAAMTTWPVPKTMATDAVTGATPLGILQEGGGDLPSNLHMFLGFIGGSVGEVSAVALLIGGLFLIWRKVISPVIPACFIGTVAVYALLAHQDPIFHICAGGVMLGAFFMATDYATTPNMTLGKVIFGIGCGILTMTIRLFGNYPEGVSFAILLMNILTPLINRLCIKLEIKKEVKEIEEGQ